MINLPTPEMLLHHGSDYPAATVSPVSPRGRLGDRPAAGIGEPSEWQKLRGGARYKGKLSIAAGAI